MAKFEKDTELGMKKRCFNRLRTKCKHANKYFDLSFELFVNTCEADCVFCGEEPTKKLWKGYSIPWFANGIDRINSAKGYSEDNIQTCCAMCNRLKSDLGEMEFLLHLKRIFLFRKLGELTDE